MAKELYFQGTGSWGTKDIKVDEGSYDHILTVMDIDSKKEHPDFMVVLDSSGQLWCKAVAYTTTGDTKKLRKVKSRRNTRVFVSYHQTIADSGDHG